LKKKQIKKKNKITLWKRVNDIIEVSPHMYQAITLIADVKEIFLSTGVGSGKTSWAAVWLSFQQFLNPGHNVIWTEPTAGMIERVGLPAYLEFIEGTVFEGGWKNKKMGIYENMFGYTYFMTAEKPEHIQGVHACAAVMDESGQCSRKAYGIIKGRLAQEDGILLGLTNPYHNKDPWLYKEVFRRWQNHDKELLFLNYSSMINPAFNRARYEYDKAHMSKKEFEFQYLGIYSKPTGLVFTYDDKIITDVILEEGTTYAGMDFGVGDPTVLEVGHLDKNGMHLIDEYYQASLAPSDHVNAIARMIQKYNIATIFYDPGAKASQLEIAKGLEEKKVSVLWKRADNAIEKGIKEVNKWIIEGRLTISPNNFRMLDEDISYVYGTDGLPSKKNNHCQDARRYMMMGVARKLRGRNKHTPPTREPNFIRDYFEGLFKKKSTKKDWVQYR